MTESLISNTKSSNTQCAVDDYSDKTWAFLACSNCILEEYTHICHKPSPGMWAATCFVTTTITPPYWWNKLIYWNFKQRNIYLDCILAIIRLKAYQCIVWVLRWWGSNITLWNATNSPINSKSTLTNQCSDMQ